MDDPEVGRRRKDVQAEMSEEGGTLRAADLIEAELRGRAGEQATRDRRFAGRRPEGARGAARPAPAPPRPRTA